MNTDNQTAASQRILIVDDDSEIRDLVARHGFRCLVNEQADPSQSRGKHIGTACQLENGEIIYVPDGE